MELGRTEVEELPGTLAGGRAYGSEFAHEDALGRQAKSARTLAITSRTPGSAARWRSRAHPRRDAKDMDQAVDRHHQNVVLDPLDAPRTDEAHDAQSAIACPSSPAP